MEDLKQFIKRYKLPEQYEEVLILMLESKTIKDIADILKCSRPRVAMMQQFLYDYFNIEKYDTGGHKHTALAIKIYKDYIEYLKEGYNASISH